MPRAILLPIYKSQAIASDSGKLCSVPVTSVQALRVLARPKSRNAYVMLRKVCGIARRHNRHSAVRSCREGTYSRWPFVAPCYAAVAKQHNTADAAYRRVDNAVRSVACGITSGLIRVSNCLESQAFAVTDSLMECCHAVCVRTMTLRIVSSLRMHATSASFFGLPAATRC